MPNDPPPRPANRIEDPRQPHPSHHEPPVPEPGAKPQDIEKRHRERKAPFGPRNNPGEDEGPEAA